jgi:hypothetical protein
MSKYTTTFRNLIEGGFVTREEIENIFKSYNMLDYLTQEEVDVINTRGTWTPSKLAKKIVDHYYLKDLGFETYSMFKHYAKIQMEEIMESKLPLIYSSAIKYDPLVNVDYTEQLTRNYDVNSNSSSNSSASGSGLVVNSDTPQTNINKESILNGSYASSTSANETNTSGNDNVTTTSNTDEDYIKRVKGNSGVSATAQKMVEQYRDNIRAIDYEIIKELNDLFMGLF